MTDEDGPLRLHGRLDQVINRGGEKILPDQLEDPLNSCDDVADVSVIGLPDPVLAPQPHRQGRPRSHSCSAAQHL